MKRHQYQKRHSANAAATSHGPTSRATSTVTVCRCGSIDREVAVGGGTLSTSCFLRAVESFVGDARGAVDVLLLLLLPRSAADETFSSPLWGEGKSSRRDVVVVATTPGEDDPANCNTIQPTNATTSVEHGGSQSIRSQGDEEAFRQPICHSHGERGGGLTLSTAPFCFVASCGIGWLNLF